MWVIIKDIVYCTVVFSFLFIGYLLGKNFRDDEREQNLAKRIVELQKDNKFLKQQLANLRENERLSDEFINKQDELADAKEIIRKMLFVLGEYRVGYRNNPHFELIDKAEAFLKGE